MVSNHEDDGSLKPIKRGESGFHGGASTSIWSFQNASKISIFNHKQQGKHKKDLIATLGITGPATPYAIAKIVTSLENKILSKKHDDIISEITGFSKRKDYYYRIVNGRFDNDKTYPGLIKKGFVGIANDSTDGKIFLTLKGCILAINFGYADSELEKFIQKASEAHLYFAYVDKILQDTNIDFVKELFINPIRKLIVTNKIDFDQNIEFYFSNIAESNAYALSKLIAAIFGASPEKSLSKIQKQNQDRNVQMLIENTWYVMDPNTVEWTEKMRKFFYRNKEVLHLVPLIDGSTRELEEDNAEFHLFWKTMREIHMQYYLSQAKSPPKKYTQKFPYRIRRQSWWTSSYKDPKPIQKMEKLARMYLKNKKSIAKRYQQIRKTLLDEVSKYPLYRNEVKQYDEILTGKSSYG